MDKTIYDSSNRAEYYQMMTEGDIERLTVETIDFLLRTGDYKYLPYEVTRVIYACLERYKNDGTSNELIYRLMKRPYEIAVREEGSGKYITYQFETDPKIHITYYKDQVYYNFFKYYFKSELHQYFNIEIPNKKIHSSPMMEYELKTSLQFRTMFWYIGEEKAKGLIEEYTKRFMASIRESIYDERYTKKYINNTKGKVCTHIENIIKDENKNGKCRIVIE